MTYRVRVSSPARRDRARRGQYRVVYRIDDDQILGEVIRIAHRSDVYRS